MIAFAASSNTNRAGGGPKPYVVGKWNGGSIYNTDMAEARQEWIALKRYVTFTARSRYTGQEEQHSILDSVFPAASIAEMDQKPELFMLLRTEAVDAGMQPNKDDVQDIMTNHYAGPTGPDDDTREFTEDAVTNLLRIVDNFNRLARDVKISQPQRDMALAKAGQNIQLNVVEVAAARFSPKVAAPTTQAVQTHFEKYADVVPGKPQTPDNPFGYGYRLADRVKLQYVQIDRGAAEKVVEATQSPYDWDVAARLYYLQHKDEFAATQPTTEPAVNASPKPYEQVRDQALRSVREPMVAKLVLDVQNKILGTMQNDWRSWSSSSGASASGEPYPSYAYLHKLCADVQTQFKLTVFASEQDHDYLSADELAALPGIGESEAASVPFAQGAMQRATAYLTGSQDNAAKAQLMMPSEALFDHGGNVFIYRLTDVRAAERAPDVETVAVKIESDLRAAEAYRMAQEQAKALMAAAGKSTLAGAAAKDGLTVVNTEPFSANYPFLGDGITLSDSGQVEFIKQAFDLLSGYDPRSGAHPMEIIELPQDGKIYVAQLATVTPSWNETNFYQVSLRAGDELRAQEVLPMMQQWLSYDLVTQRTAYQAQTPKS
jgi:hypothetical protein